jgi:Uma2 family endonuclease
MIELSFPPIEQRPTEEDLPYDDGEPMESGWHRAAMNLLIECIEYHLQERKDFYVGGNQFIYFSKEEVFNRDFRGPDFYFIKDVEHDRLRLSWVAWQENDRLPNVIVELTSPSTEHIDRVAKKVVYAEKMHVPDYFIYDPYAADPLEGWRLSSAGYGAALPVDAKGQIWSQELNLYIGTWVGTFQGHFARWPRFFDAEGNVIPTFGEAGMARAALADRKAQEEAERAALADRKAQEEAERAALADRKAQQAEAARIQADLEIDQLKQELEALKRKSTTPQ